MSRLCRLKTASHGDDGKWAYDEIVSLRKQRDELEFAVDVQSDEIERLRIRILRDTVPDSAAIQRKREDDAEAYSKAKLHLLDRIEKLANQRDELLAALDVAMENLRSHGDNCFVSEHYEGDPGAMCNCGIDGVTDYLISAIASVKGEQ